MIFKCGNLPLSILKSIKRCKKIKLLAARGLHENRYYFINEEPLHIV